MKAVTIAKRLNEIFIVLALLGDGANAQSQKLQPDGSAQAVGLFAQACLQFAGNPAAVRHFLNAKQVPALSADATRIFLKDHIGVGFDASNRVTRMALISEDNSVCSVFAESVDTTAVNPLLQTVTRKAGLQLNATDERERGGLTSRFYKVAIAGRPYNIVVSTGNDEGRAFHAALTLAPEP
ncbi:NMCC_0638 family (lipo)protein [Xanthobacter versatilis]|uniref:NMCC_0638 family (lipo)protein n=1 Tax=Xanthobacter autotrophicus (strain ATCC BAA-1158 / Py2) TaxID=78245 RepID=UPI00372C0513